VNFEWGPQKAIRNFRKHGVDFAHAVGVFEGESAMTIDDGHPDEECYVTIGIDALMRVLVVVWTMRDENIRIISARKATHLERQQYEEGT
jgi:uncharacterized DUF497 family protein